MIYTNMSMSIKLSGLPGQVNQLAHAYVVEGYDLESLFQQSQLLAKTLLCSNKQQTSDGEFVQPCQRCHSCELFDAGSHPDFTLVEAEKTSIGVDEIRQTSTFLNKTSQLSGSQVVVLKQADLMTENASNALLKTLEEPTANSYLLLLTDKKRKLLPTILSRCQFLTLDGLSKKQLKNKYPDLPDYVIGFRYQSESDLIRWQEEDKIAQFEQVFSLFMGWLKHTISSPLLIAKVGNDQELHDFLMYLLTRRIRQLMMKTQYVPQATKAQKLLSHYHTSHTNIVGVNKPLALNALLAEIITLVN
ncbi:MAG: hypothetical protein HWE10_06690 [Gammaproteobacteria bacterium]|nr:hypothetical protein [Gammaproteobacteria bacterium]